LFDSTLPNWNLAAAPRLESESQTLRVDRGPSNPSIAWPCCPQRRPGNPGPFRFDGISTGGFDHVEILGPGMVQKFRRHGIFVFESEKATIKHVTAHDNCFSGLLLGLSDDNDVEENVSVRKGSASGAAPCGGNCLTNSHNNRIRRNEFSGNGSVAPGAPAGTPE
jgi:hypothetical protein